MNATTETLMTAEEFLNRHGGETGVELVRGRVVRYPMAGAKHGEVNITAGAILHDFVKARGLGRVMSNDTFVRTATDPITFRGADVCYVSYSRLPREVETPDGPLEVPPELVIEVRSPSDRLNQLTAKATEYIAAGVSVVVILDPHTESAAVLRLDDFPQRFHNGDELTLPDVLPGFAVPVRRFFE